LTSKSRNSCPFFAKFFLDRLFPGLRVHISKLFTGSQRLLSFLRPGLRVHEQAGEAAMMRIEGLRSGPPGSGPILPDKSGGPARMKLDGGVAWNDLTGLSNL
jgi:hypothetical protein